MLVSLSAQRVIATKEYNNDRHRFIIMGMLVLPLRPFHTTPLPVRVSAATGSLVERERVYVERAYCNESIETDEPYVYKIDM